MVTFEALKTAVNGLLAKIEKVKSIKPNWNQNDSSADDYIRNRPFYTGDTVKTVLVDNVSVEVANAGEPIYNPFSINIVDGKTYAVTWNGTVYECVAYIAEGPDAPSIGNGANISVSGGDNEPFFVTVYEGDVMLFTSEAGTHTVSITTQETEIKKIDIKYLPETGVGRAGTGKNAEIFNDYKENIASGEYSHAEGIGSWATGPYSHAEGEGTTAKGEASHAEGIGSTASAYASHAEGSNTTADGNYSHAEGYGNSAYGNYSHVEGYNNASAAAAVYSHVEGYYTKAESEYQHVQGKYNTFDNENKYAHIVGNGTGGTTSERSNAHTIDWNGVGWFAGGLKVGGTGQDSVNAVDVALKTDITNKFTEIILTDSTNGFDYHVKMIDGNLVSYGNCVSIRVETPPNKIAYLEGEVFDPTGMVVVAVQEDGEAREITGYTCDTTALTLGQSEVNVSYIENGATFETKVNIATTVPYDYLFSDFTYNENNDGTYTITGWNGTTGGAASTEILIPSDENIII